MTTKLRITGDATASHSVPAHVLIRAVQGMQQSVLLLAAARKQKQVRTRFRPEAELRLEYTLRVHLPTPGSYALPLTLSDDRPQRSVLPYDGDVLLDSMGAVFEAIASNSLDTIRCMVPDSTLFTRLLQELRRLMPRPGDLWGVALGSEERGDVELTTRHRPVIERWLSEANVESETSVIGELLSINFAEKRLRIRYPVTSREIECSYLDEVEETIIEARRGYFQVTGQFVLDDDGHPKRLTDVRSVEPVDLSPMQLRDVWSSKTHLIIDPPIELVPELDPETKQCFQAAVPEWGVFLYSTTRDGLASDFADNLLFAWEEYAKAEPDELTEDAIALRDALRAQIHEES